MYFRKLGGGATPPGGDGVHLARSGDVVGERVTSRGARAEVVAGNAPRHAWMPTRLSGRVGSLSRRARSCAHGAIVAVVLTSGAALASRASTFSETPRIHSISGAANELVHSVRHPLHWCPKRRASLTPTLAVHRGHSPAWTHSARVPRSSNPSLSASGVSPNRSSNALDTRPSGVRGRDTHSPSCLREGCRKICERMCCLRRGAAAAIDGCPQAGLRLDADDVSRCELVAEGKELLGPRLSDGSVTGEPPYRPRSAIVLLPRVSI
jgi:hypothetical protein